MQIFLAPREKGRKATMYTQREGCWYTTADGYLARLQTKDIRPELPLPMFYVGGGTQAVEPVETGGPLYAAYEARTVLRSSWAGEQLRLAAARELRRAVRA